MPLKKKTETPSRDPEMIEILQGVVDTWQHGEDRAKEYVRHQQMKKEHAKKRLDNYMKYGDPDYGMKK